MAFRVFFPAIAVLACLVAGPVRADEAPRGCLDRMEQRGMVMSGHAIPFAVAIRSVRPENGDEILRARLCYGPRGMIWTVTVLSRTGQVRSVKIDARNGAFIGDH